MTNKKIRIVHVLWSGHFGGTERFVRDIVFYSNHQIFAHQVIILSEGTWLIDQLSYLNMGCHCIGMKTGLSVRCMPKLAKLIKEIQPDIIHNHCRNYLFNTVFMHNKIPGIYFEHGGDIIGERKARDILFYRLFARFYDLILVNSNFVMQRIRKSTRIDSRKVKTFYIGIDPEGYRHFDKDSRRERLFGNSCKKHIIGTVARLVDQKGIDDFILTAVEVKHLSQDISFVIIGDGEKRRELEQMAKKLDVEITFMGFRSDVPNILCVFDIFLITSKWEPFGITVLEAMAAGVPIVGFAVDGVREIIDAGGGGVLIDQRCPKTLAKAVIDTVRNKKKYRLLQKQGSLNVRRNFDITGCMNRLEKHYLSVFTKTHENTTDQ